MMMYNIESKQRPSIPNQIYSFGIYLLHKTNYQMYSLVRNINSQIDICVNMTFNDNKRRIFFFTL